MGLPLILATLATCLMPRVPDAILGMQMLDFGHPSENFLAKVSSTVASSSGQTFLFMVYT